MAGPPFASVGEPEEPNDGPVTRPQDSLAWTVYQANRFPRLAQSSRFCAVELCRRLMALYQRRGRRAEALATYQRCRATLAAKLGLAPAPETEPLHRALRAGQ